MRIAVVLVLLVLPLLTEGAQAKDEGLLAFDDPVGDTRLDYPPVPIPAVWANGVDIVKVEISVAREAALDVLNATLTLANLGAVSITDVGVFPDTMFGVRFALSGTERDGTWTVRADYQPLNSVPWSFFAEGPCLDGNDEDGCAGSDRDIHDDVPGGIALEMNTVTIGLPLSLVGNRTVNATVTADYAFTDEVWPSYPIYAGDRAADSRRTVAPVPASPLASPPSPTSSGPAPSPPPAVETPVGPAVLVAVVAGALLAQRRRSR